MQFVFAFQRPSQASLRVPANSPRKRGERNPRKKLRRQRLLQSNRGSLTPANLLQDRKQPLKPADHLHRASHRAGMRLWRQVTIPALPRPG